MFSYTSRTGMRLKDWKMKPIFLAPVARQLLVAEALDFLAVDEDPPLARRVDTAEHVEHRALARSRGAGDREELAPLYLEIDAPQGLDLGLAEHVMLLHVPQFHDRHHVPPSP